MSIATLAASAGVETSSPTTGIGSVIKDAADNPVCTQSVGLPVSNACLPRRPVSIALAPVPRAEKVPKPNTANFCGYILNLILPPVLTISSIIAFPKVTRLTGIR